MAPLSANTGHETASLVVDMKVIFVPFSDRRPSGLPVDVLTGFVSVDGKAFGRPVGVAVDRAGALLLVDDVGNRVWRVGPAAQTAAVE